MRFRVRRKQVPASKLGGRSWRIPALFFERAREHALAEQARHDPSVRLQRIAAALPKKGGRR